jgi:hypothetical protein
VKKMRFSLKTSKRTNGLETERTVQSIIVNICPKPRHMVQSVTGNFIFTSCLIALVSLFWSCFSINKTNDRSFLNIRGYGTSRELYEGALRPS